MVDDKGHHQMVPRGQAVGELTVVRLVVLTLGLWKRPSLLADWSHLQNKGGLKDIISEDSKATGGRA